MSDKNEVTVKRAVSFDPRKDDRQVPLFLPPELIQMMIAWCAILLDREAGDPPLEWPEVWYAMANACLVFDIEDDDLPSELTGVMNGAIMAVSHAVLQIAAIVGTTQPTNDATIFIGRMSNVLGTMLADAEESRMTRKF